MSFIHEPEKLPTLSIGKDLDGCYYLFERAWYNAAVTYGVVDPKAHPFKIAARWEFYEDFGCDLEMFLKVCNRAADDGLLWAEGPMPGTIATWRQLGFDGHELHVKTDRSFGTHPIASVVGTRMWLNSHGLPFHSITFSADKTAGPAVDIMLEDKIANYDALDATGVEVWLIDRGWNQDDGSRRRVFTHDEFYTRVQAMQRRRAAEAAAA